MTAHEIAQLLANSAEGVCRHLLPQGKLERAEWLVGSIRGEPGKSLKVRVSGDKVGVWSDFAANQGGDLLNLWAMVRGISISEAMDEAKRWLGVRDTKPELRRPRKREYRPIPHAPEPPPSALVEYAKTRGINTGTLEAYKVTLSEDEACARFPAYHGDDVLMIKSVGIKRKGFHATKDAPKVLIGWQAVPDNARFVVITEGEWDALSYYQHGIPAMSMPFGAGTGAKLDWLENELDRLDRFDDVYLSMDMDEAGQATLPELIDRIGRHRCRVIQLPMKDANECHVAGVDLSEHFDAAKTLDPVELVSATDFFEDVYAEFHGEQKELAGYALPWPKTHGKFRIRRGETTLWAGIGGHGKSMFLDHIVVGTIKQGAKWCIASMEMPPPVHLKRLYQQSGAAPTPSRILMERIRDYLDGHVWLFDVQGTAKASRIMEVFDYARRRYGIDNFLIDSMTKCGFEDDDYPAQKAFLDVVSDFDRAYKVHTHVVVHMRKRDDEMKMARKMDIKGSGGMADLADNVAIVYRNKGKEEKVANAATGQKPDEKIANSPDCIITIDKQRNFPFEGRFSFWYDSQTNQYLEHYGADPVDYAGARL